jgi:EAL domain-containing protein (putative c-di-GMP-specific phosphodiesterase class I)
VSARTVKSSHFRAWLATVLKENQAIANQLVFSFSAYSVAKEPNTYKEFIDYVGSLNAKTMVKRFETYSLSPEGVKDLKPDYIRLARDMSNGLHHEAEKAEFVRTMVELGELLEMGILAENVREEKDYDALTTIGVLGASR